MSQAAQMPSSQVSRQITELIDEIAFQRVLLSSIDDSVQDREDAEKDVRDEIRSLEHQLRDLRRSTATTASISRPSNPSSQSLQAASSSSSRNHTGNSFDGAHDEDTAEKTAMNGYLAREQWHPLTSQSSTASTPNSDFLGDFVSPSQMNLPTRKRSHSKHLDGQLAPFENNKSRRTSMSPFGTGPPTPSTLSSGDEAFEAFDREYLQHQKDEANRLEMERLDEEFARSLQDDFNAPPMNTSSSSSMQPPARSAFDRMSGAHQPSSSYSNPYASSSSPRNGTNPGRKLPWNTPSSGSTNGPSIKAEPRLMASGIKRETSASSMSGFSPYGSSIPPSNSSTSGIKREAPARLAPSYNNPYASSVPPNGFKSEPSFSRPMPCSFQDDSSTASDSDIEIIPASAFRDNGRHSNTAGTMGNGYNSTQPKFEPFGTGSSAAELLRARQSASNDALQRAMFGNQSMPNWMNGASSQPGAAGDFVYPYSNGNMQLGSSKTDMSDHSSMNNVPVFEGYGAMAAGLSHIPNHNPLADIIARSGEDNYNELSDYLNLGDGMQDQLQYIMNDPRKNAQEIKDLLENIRPDVEHAPEDREGTPEGLVYPLYEHQKIALSWLKAMEEGTNKGGILADDMGLGKTISALALLLARPSSDRQRRTTLIVGPVALVRQWDREIRKKIKPGFRLSTYMMHGSSRKPSWDDLRTYDVVLTTYGTLGAEFKRLLKLHDKMKLDGIREFDQVPMKKTFPLLGPRSTFYRIILDEAQCIKNKATGAARACCSLQASYRFCLTGTPMMNNVGELYSLIHFLRIKPYNEWTRFQQTFGMLTKGDGKRRDANNALTKLQALLKAILLRRTKLTLIDGKPIITLPPKTEEVSHVVFDEDEQAFYTALETKTQLVFNKYMKAGTVGKNYTNVLVLLLRLRQACCHPHLIQDFDKAPPIGGDTEAMLELARSLAPEVVARILDADDVFECPVCYDPVLDPRIITPCGHDTCTECLAKISDQAVQQNVANGNDGGGNSRCPTCRGDLIMSKVIDYGTFKKVHKSDPADANDEEEETASDSETDSEADEETESGSDADSHTGNLRGFVVPDDVEDTTDDEDEADEEDNADKDEEEVAPRKSRTEGKGKQKKEKRKFKGNAKGKKVEKQHFSIAMLKKEATKTAEGRRRYMKYLRKNWQPSAKVTKTVELLDEFLADGQKTIIFSQFVSLLDLLQVPIDEKKWKCLRYDGGMSADARNSAINTFTDSPTHNIMLISLKAGNAGLNLVAASRVIILDPFWNPFIEMQAVDRAYRIGQQRPVQVHRILIKATVEDRIIELQEQKRSLVESALDENAAKNLSRLGVRELAYLFGVGDR